MALSRVPVQHNRKYMDLLCSVRAKDFGVHTRKIGCKPDWRYTRTAYSVHSAQTEDNEHRLFVSIVAFS